MTPVVAQETKATANASEIADKADRATASLTRAARLSKDPALAPSASGAKPFWQALKSLNTAVAKLGNGLEFKDGTFHPALGETVTQVSAVAAAFELSGASDKQVENAISRMEKIVGVLQGNFSKAAARQRKGGGLSTSEKNKLEAIRAKQRELETRLGAIEPKLRNNPRAMRGFNEIRRRSYEVSRSGDTLGDFLAAMVAVRIIDGLLWGCHWWWGPWGAWYPGFSIGYIGIHNTIIADIDYDWVYYDALQADIDEIEIEDAIDDSDLLEAEEFLENQDIDLADGLAESELHDIAAPLPEDIDNPDYGLTDDTSAELPDEGEAELPDDAAALPDQGVDTDIETPVPIDKPQFDDEQAGPEAGEFPAEELPAQPAEVEEFDAEPAFEDLPPEPDIDFAPDIGGDDFMDFGDGGFDDLDGGFDFD
ncbi:hypothetical protein [Stappia sediminis]|uniref:hypothetical protein n=1 Tax=Stappia sediminis TaxID=2692190 RepID=UPI001AD94089|nr:hypothetical protein [Stappia sediminis]